MQSLCNNVFIGISHFLGHVANKTEFATVKYPIDGGNSLNYGTVIPQLNKYKKMLL